MTKAIGIDLGTCNSCVGVWINDRIEIIPNDHGNRKTPAYVSFSDVGCLIGEAAKDQAGLNPRNTVYATQRLMGRKFGDAKVQSHLNQLPFKITCRGDRPFVEISHKGGTRQLAPEEVSSLILYKLRCAAESYLGGTVKDVVVSVPASYNGCQRQATKDAGVIAGLNVLRIIDAPTLAAFSYGISNMTSDMENILIFDFGGGTCSVSLVGVDDGIYEVKATAGDTQLGGEDVTNRLVDHFIQYFKRKQKKDISNDPRALFRLRSACDRAKCTLSSSSQATIELDSILEGVDLYATISRALFELLCEDLFDRTIELVKRVLRDSKTDKSDVHKLALIGGSSQIPIVKELLSDFFDGQQPEKCVISGEATTGGAAIQAAILTGDTSELTSQVLLLDVAPLSIGIELPGGGFTPVIERNTQVPTKISKIISNAMGNQTDMLVKVFEGEHPRTRDNYLLGELQLSGIQLDHMGLSQVEVVFEVDANGILCVSATDTIIGRSNRITITNDRRRLSKEEIERMVNQAVMYQAEDQDASSRVIARNSLEVCAVSLRRSLMNLEAAVEDTVSWLDASSDAPKEEYEHKQKELESLVKLILTKSTRKPI